MPLQYKTADEALYAVITLIDQISARADRAPQTDEWRSGWRTCARDLEQSGTVEEARDTLASLGWTRPSRHWRRPTPAAGGTGV